MFYKYLKKYKEKLLFLIIVCILFAFAYFKNQSNTIEDFDLNEIKMAGEYNEDIIIHIDGEINKPGILKIKKDSRLYEAIELAGGLTKFANEKALNLSLKLNDEDKIIIPSINNEVLGEVNQNIQIVKPEVKKVNINNANKSDLMNLDGVGKGLSERIIKHRDKEKFTCIEDLKKVNGIGDTKFESIKDDITVE